MESRRNVLVGLGGIGVVGGAAYLLGKSENPNTEPTTTPEPSATPTDNSEFSPSEEWSQFQGDSRHTGFYSQRTLLSAQPKLRWEYHTGAPSRSGLIASEQYIIEKRRSAVQALEKTTGEVAWNTADSVVDEFSFACDPVVHGNFVIFAGTNRRTRKKELVAVDALSGVDQWRLKLSGVDEYFHGLSVNGDRLCILRRNNDTQEVSITAVSLTEQEVQWTHNVSAFDQVNRPVAMSSQIIVYGGYMEYVRTDATPTPHEPAGGVVALNPDTGTEIWRSEVGGTQNPVTILDGTVIATPDQVEGTNAEHQQDGKYPLIALDASNGKVKWKFETTEYFYSSPAATPEYVYFGIDNTIWAVKTEDGSLGWKQKMERWVNRAPLAVVGNTLLVGDFDFDHESTSVTAFNRMNGEVKWQHEVPEGNIIDVISVDGAVFAKGETYHDEDSATIRAFW
jgi:outer membrane protein assembly factor BamB